LRGDKPAYGNLIALGEVLLGYRNEYDRYTDRPLLSSGGVNDLLPPAEDDASKRDLGRNGTYLVLRDLLQDVRAFWSFAKTETIASAFVGRTPKGDPLVQAGTDQNDFTFAQDPDGTRCPFGAHIRRANPRNGDFPSVPTGPIATLLAMLGFGKQRFHDDITSSVRFHRIVRRGREYGPPLASADATLPAPPDDPARGLRFVCLNANIGRQFEFLQSAWFASSKFNGLAGESDPLLGNREPGPNGESTDAFVMNRADAAPARLTGVPQFVTVTGGAYFFLPGLSALRYISQSA
jgi:deferrochelatase/peroxidase EfeB